ncbi:MAG: biotin--[acetyl-CoA-carboxylase] ligase [Campylobacteraceae bacterium]|nr:biotin--[acetyl-CoA-carboxylase] ligase [Campylobacteraceae bacterium]
MVINWFNELGSTHQYLVDGLKSGTLRAPLGIGTYKQTNGIGSRGNIWIEGEGNLFFSFCVEEKHLPDDLPLASISIYFAFLMKHILEKEGSAVWLKWPNDFYLDDKKIGGMMTTKIGTNIIGSVGLNLCTSPVGFGVLDIKIMPKVVANLFSESVEKKISWKNVFSKYKIEFQNNRSFSFHLDGKSVSLSDAILCDDGSIELENKKVYSLR